MKSKATREREAQRFFDAYSKTYQEALDILDAAGIDDIHKAPGDESLEAFAGLIARSILDIKQKIETGDALNAALSGGTLAYAISHINTRYAVDIVEERDEHLKTARESAKNAKAENREFGHETVRKALDAGYKSGEFFKFKYPQIADLLRSRGAAPKDKKGRQYEKRTLVDDLLPRYAPEIQEKYR